MLAIDSLSEACVQGSVYVSGAVNCLVDVYKLHSCGRVCIGNKEEGRANLTLGLRRCAEFHFLGVRNV